MTSIAEKNMVEEECFSMQKELTPIIAGESSAKKCQEKIRDFFLEEGWEPFFEQRHQGGVFIFAFEYLPVPKKKEISFKQDATCIWERYIIQVLMSPIKRTGGFGVTIHFSNGWGGLNVQEQCDHLLQDIMMKDWDDDKIFQTVANEGMRAARSLTPKEALCEFERKLLSMGFNSYQEANIPSREKEVYLASFSRVCSGMTILVHVTQCVSITEDLLIFVVPEKKH